MSKIILKFSSIFFLIFLLNLINVKHTQAMWPDDFGQPSRHFTTAKQNLLQGKDRELKEKLDLIAQAKNAPAHPFSKTAINNVRSKAVELLRDPNNPENQARGAILYTQIGIYYAETEGNIDKAIEDLQRAAAHDPEAAKELKILLGIKKAKEKEEEERKQAEKKAAEGSKQEANNKFYEGAAVGVGGMVVVIGVCSIIQWLSGSQPSSPGNI